MVWLFTMYLVVHSESLGKTPQVCKVWVWVWWSDGLCAERPPFLSVSPRAVPVGLKWMIILKALSKNQSRSMNYAHNIWISAAVDHSAKVGVYSKVLCLWVVSSWGPHRPNNIFWIQLNTWMQQGHFFDLSWNMVFFCYLV